MKLSNRKLANPFIYQGYESLEYFRTFKAHFLRYRFIFGLFRILFSLLFIVTNVKNTL